MDSNLFVLGWWGGSPHKCTCHASLMTWVWSLEPMVEEENYLMKVVPWPPHVHHSMQALAHAHPCRRSLLHTEQPHSLMVCSRARREMVLISHFLTLAVTSRHWRVTPAFHHGYKWFISSQLELIKMAARPLSEVFCQLEDYFAHKVVRSTHC